MQQRSRRKKRGFVARRMPWNGAQMDIRKYRVGAHTNTKLQKKPTYAKNVVTSSSLSSSNTRKGRIQVPRAQYIHTHTTHERYCWYRLMSALGGSRHQRAAGLLLPIGWGPRPRVKWVRLVTAATPARDLGTRQLGARIRDRHSTPPVAPVPMLARLTGCAGYPVRFRLLN